MNMMKKLVIATCVSLLIGCGSDNENINEQKQVKQELNEKHKSVLSNQQLQALESAKGIEKMLSDAEEKRIDGDGRDKRINDLTHHRGHGILGPPVGSGVGREFHSRSRLESTRARTSSMAPFCRAASSST